MKFFQVHGFYNQYLACFYQNSRDLISASYQAQVQALLKDGYAASHLFAPYMKPIGYDSEIVFFDNQYSQFQWLYENEPGAVCTENWKDEIVIRQITAASPDILFLPGLKCFDSSFVRKLPKRPPIVMGWYGIEIEKEVDLSCFDVILSNSHKILNQAQEAGVKNAVWFFPGMPEWIAEEVSNLPKTQDISFTGSWTSAHTRRNKLLTAVADKLPTCRSNSTISYHLLSSIPVASVVAKFNKAPLWGMAMYRLLRQSRIAFNADIDGFDNETGNMRLVEATAAGSFVLTEYHDNISQYFEPGVEIETFRDEEELIEKICYYLDHPEKRETIARKGQERCLRDYSMTKRSQELDEIIKRIMQPVPVPSEDLYDKAYYWGWNQPELKELIYLCYKTPDLVDNARRFSMSEAFKEAVSLLISMGKAPCKNIKILDIGCGNGVASYALSRLGYSVIGIDSSIGKLAGLGAASRLIGLDGADFTIKHSSGESLDFADGSFDIVWMREVLHHIHDLKGFLKEASRVLKQSGIICCMRDHVIWNESQRDHFFETHPFYHITRDEGCYYLNEYLHAFAETGFSMERVLGPTDSVINTYPATWQPGLVFDSEAAKRRLAGNDLFSFFARKIVPPPVEPASSGEIIETGNSILLDSFNIAGRIESGHTYLKTGNDCMLGAVFEFVSPYSRVTIGERVYIGGGTRVICSQEVVFGNDILVAWGCTFIDHDSYPEDAETRKAVISDKMKKFRQGVPDWDMPEGGTIFSGRITIGDNAWIGMNCVILKGVTIGEGAVVGGCSVVTEDVEPWSVVIGNPARRIR